ncbi:hypothetical protein BZA77DRAFT_297437 [Pyronema omphalodes]|nr:hypothetical protein BZA77DRAFT_297437 [Pyronema omphalodes]
MNRLRTIYRNRPRFTQPRAPDKNSGSSLPVFPQAGEENIAVKQEALDEDDDLIGVGLSVQEEAEARSAAKQEHPETDSFPPTFYEFNSAGSISSVALGPQTFPARHPTSPEVRESRTSGESEASPYDQPAQWTAVNTAGGTLPGPSPAAVVAVQRSRTKKTFHNRVSTIGLFSPAQAADYQSSTSQRQEVRLTGSSSAHSTPVDEQTAPQQEGQPTRPAKRCHPQTLDEDASAPAPKKPRKKSSFGKMIAKQYREGDRHNYWDW